jgi:cell division protein FtsQ
LPAVRSATVERRWPHTVVITVGERQPLLGVRQPGGYLIVDNEGVAYQNSPTLPRGAMTADVNPGAVDLLTQVGMVAAGMPDQLRGKVTSIGALKADGIEVKLVSGVVVRWGTSADSPLKSQIVLALLKQKPKVSIDVTSPHNPAIR